MGVLQVVVLVVQELEFSSPLASAHAISSNFFQAQGRVAVVAAVTDSATAAVPVPVGRGICGACGACASTLKAQPQAPYIACGLTNTHVVTCASDL